MKKINHLREKSTSTYGLLAKFKHLRFALMLLMATLGVNVAFGGVNVFTAVSQTITDGNWTIVGSNASASSQSSIIFPDPAAETGFPTGTQAKTNYYSKLSGSSDLGAKLTEAKCVKIKGLSAGDVITIYWFGTSTNSSFKWDLSYATSASAGARIGSEISTSYSTAKIIKSTSFPALTSTDITHIESGYVGSEKWAYISSPTGGYIYAVKIESAGPVDPTVTFSNANYEIGETLDLSTLFKSNSTGAVTYTVKTDGGTSASINGTNFTATTAGSCVVTASQAAVSGTYNAKSLDATVTVTAASVKSAIVYDNTKGASTAALPTQYTEGVGIAEFAALEDVTGFHFTGWNPSSISASATGEQTITAEWEQLYTVTFDAGEGTGSMDAAEYAAGAEVTIPACAFTAPAGKVFDAWTSNDVEIVDGKFTMPANAVTVTATWKKDFSPIALFSMKTAASGNVSVAANADHLALPDAAKLTISGGSVTVSNGQTSAKNLVTSDGFSMTNGNTYFTVTLNETLKAGDVISATMSATGRGLKFSTNNSWSDSYPGGAAATTSFTYTVEENDGICGVSTFNVFRGTSNTTTFNNFQITRQNHGDIESVAYAGKVIVNEEEKNIAADAENVITLDGAYATEPSVVLVKTITYEDETQKEENVVVELAADPVDGFFVGTVTIDEVEYTIKAAVSSAAEMELSEESGTLALGIATSNSLSITLTGANLEDGTYDVSVPEVEGLSIAPTSFTVADGAVNQEFTITYASNADVTSATANFVFTVGDNSTTYTLTYQSTAPIEQTSVSEATTWDWTKTGATGNIQLTEATTPTKSEEFIMANIPGVNNDANFNSAALSMITEYVVRDKKYFQGGYIKFHTTVPGIVEVVFSNTGGDRPNRYVYVNGISTGIGSNKSDANHKTATANVPAGDVEIEAYFKESDFTDGSYTTNGKTTPYEASSQYIRVYRITFTPTYSRNVNTNFGTICLPYAVAANAHEGITFYNVAGVQKNDEEVITGVVFEEETRDLVAGKPYVLKAAEEGTMSLTLSGAAESLQSATGLVGNLGERAEIEYDGSNTALYILSNNQLRKVVCEGVYVGQNKAYFDLSDVDVYTPQQAAAPGRISLSVEGYNTATGIDALENSEDAVKFMKDGQLFILRNGVLYNALGQVVE